ncbi:MAG: hypothetical protein LBG11_05660 [Bifidobacteriaceae bacterium]|nr:hypothetical protein [Bifidobacteriaceae bacterium]
MPIPIKPKPIVREDAPAGGSGAARSGSLEDRGVAFWPLGAELDPLADGVREAAVEPLGSDGLRFKALGIRLATASAAGDTSAARVINHRAADPDAGVIGWRRNVPARLRTGRRRRL